MDENGIVEEQKTFKGFTDSQRLSDRNQHFEMFLGNKNQAKQPISWKKGFDSDNVFPKKWTYCTECKEDSFCSGCDETINQIKELAPSPNEIRRQPAT